MENIIKEIREELRLSADEKTFKTSQNFFREKILFYGVKVPLVNKIAKANFSKIEGKS
ncbi:MAG: DNA alkylation repair protein, partial [Bacteroidales bacterium]|nr:DNA alkylation repair protein [Bacteroidales bacterium]